MEIINKSKSWFFENINKFSKFLSRLKVNSERVQIIKSEMKKKLQPIPQKYKGSEMITMYEQLYSIKMDKLEKVYKFP